MSTALLLRGVAAPEGPDFSPAELSGLTLWLRSDAGTYQDDARTILADEDLELVGGWADSSPSARHAGTATTGQKPVWKPNAAAGKPGLLCDDTDDRLNITALSLIDAVYFAVVKPSAINPSSPIGGNSINYALYMDAGGGGSFSHGNNGSSATVTGAGWTAGQTVLMAVRRVGVNCAFYKNGTHLGTVASGSNNACNLSTVGTSGGFYAFGGHLLELGIVSGTVTDGQFTDLLSYLLGRWNLA